MSAGFFIWPIERGLIRARPRVRLGGRLLGYGHPSQNEVDLVYMSGKSSKTHRLLGTSRHVLLLVAGLVLLGNLPVGSWSVCLSSLVGEGIPCDAQGPTACCPKTYSDDATNPAIVADRNPECENCIAVANHWGNGLYYSAPQKSDWAPVSVIAPETAWAFCRNRIQAACTGYKSPVQLARARLLASTVLLI